MSASENIFIPRARISGEAYDLLNMYCAKNRIMMTDLIRLALLNYPEFRKYAVSQGVSANHLESMFEVVRGGVR